MMTIALPVYSLQILYLPSYSKSIKRLSDCTWRWLGRGNQAASFIRCGFDFALSFASNESTAGSGNSWLTPHWARFRWRWAVSCIFDWLLVLSRRCIVTL